MFRNYKKLVDYLFFIWNPKSSGAKQEFHRIVEEGFGKLPVTEVCFVRSNFTRRIMTSSAQLWKSRAGFRSCLCHRRQVSKFLSGQNCDVTLS